MQVHTVSFDDFSCSDYHILGIHSALEDYQLAYKLNSFLNISFKRSSIDIDFKSKDYEAFFPLYEHTDYHSDDIWYLVSNVFKTNTKNGNNNGLFAENETRLYLIPEKKKVDYFLKVEGDFSQDSIYKINEAIHHIPGVITSYKIDTNTLKSKEFLIF
jgi:hypothetical protein